ncbi:TetR/AcrR family transcriptional regulator [Alloalcanivorax mobilis]|uniref:TetR/AcrR family transcriptional regulator n=1 Tax=Alloalcanivorax mobilis TaxID=2019569 RepID=UPI000B5B10F7|nr:TetR/AcrR family transcriptional regulator [Alloalcanivorax mobilis]ASK34950.1 TetR family transcriptional regulator [Alcanivorax sp. N3-2A]|tara:strand:+ start:1694 stop:2284 length:591 start_codon:yes stop_codon:yes gene_type:complete
MARPRQFDERTVLDAAVQCFWKHGYEATSIRDLAHHMNLTGASLYNAFGDKRALYRRALDHYLANSFGERVGRFEDKLPPAEAIRSFLNEIVERSLSDPDRKGCMLVNSALEVAPHDADFQRVVSDMLTQVEGFFYRCALAGQRDGSIADDQSPEDLARFLLGVLMGIRVLARSRPEPALLHGLVKPAFALLKAHR